MVAVPPVPGGVFAVRLKLDCAGAIGVAVPSQLDLPQWDSHLAYEWRQAICLPPFPSVI